MDPAAVKSPNKASIKSGDAPAANASGERKASGSGQAFRLGTLLPPEELGRRPSLIISDGANRKLRPGEMAADNKGRRSSLISKALEGQINQESTPLRDIGPPGKPQIVDMYDSYGAVEGETGYISAQVEGTPAPTFKFYYKGVTPLLEGIRYKFHTDGETNTVTLCIRNIKTSDEGKYKIVFTNSHGTFSDEAHLYVSKPGCTDFRTLLRKSKYAKWGKDKVQLKVDLKGVQKAQDEFLIPLKDQTAKEGKDKKVEFMAKFTRPNAKPKWFCRKNELFMGVKHKFRNDGDTYYLTVLNPKLEDSAYYTIDIGGVTSTAQLTVDRADPSYKFIKPLNKKYDGFTKHGLTLECTVSDPNAIVSWYKGDKKLTNNDKIVIDKDLFGVCSLHIKGCDLEDTGDYRCQLERQPDKTETKVKVVEYPYRFLKLLRSQQNFEKDTVTLDCELDDPLGDVKWFKDGKEIKPDGNRIQEVKEGRKRKLIIKDAKLTDGGQYSCKSNADKTEADLTVNKKNKFNKTLKDTTGVEREKVVFDIELEDEKAPAVWKLNGKPIKKSDRIEIKNLGGGKHRLVINDLKLADAGEVSVHSGDLSSSCKLTVEKGESKPQINAPKEFEGPVSKPLVIEVPFKVDGKKQTPVVAALLKDGKPLKDVEVQVKDDKVIFTIKKPTRDQSGPYQIKLSNGQGEDVKDVKITMQDVPNAPQDVNVRDVFEKSCVVDWKPPKENGGTPIQKYVIERQDLSSKKGWEPAGEVPADKPTTFKVEDLTPNKTYKFRIRAVNKVGPSEPAEFKNNVVAKNPWEAPGKPKGLEVTKDWEKDPVLKWTKPDNDGGAEITEYEIEVKDKNSKEWVKKKRVPASVASTSVEGLKEGEYDFRVRAVNKAGPGEPSDSTKLIIKPHKFNKTLKDTTGVEREKVVLDIELEDEKAPAEWKLNGKPIKPSDRVQIKNLGGGKHQLVINDLKLADAGEISVHSGKLSSSCKLNVEKGETKPQINAPKEFEGTVGAPVVIEVPYKIDGKKQTPIVAALLKDGKPLKDVEVQVKDDKVLFTIKKPTRDQSGPYQIKLSNGQGEDVKDVKITMQDVPNAPQDVNVRDVFEKSCIVDWKPPKENGGTPIQKYVIERQELSSDKGWEPAGEVPVDKPTTFKIEGLTPKKTYRFRVSAINKVGSSDPAEFKNNVLAKNPWDEPGKPKGLEVTDWDKDHADLKWTKPDSDGGAVITEYEIEVKEKNSKEWVKKKRVPASETSTTIKDLKEGQQYEFRVRAVNKAGPGEPSNATQPIVAKSRFVKPFITGDQLKKIIIKKGEQFSYQIRYGGEPEPEVKWQKDGKVLTADGKRITIEKSGGTTTLTVRKCVRSDSGKYKLILTNSSGTIESAGEVIVLDKPSPPKGPLEVTNVTDKGCKLKWNKPDDDGGVPIKQYKIEQLDTKTGKWSLLTKIGADKTEYKVTGLTDGPEYKFRVSAINDEGESDVLVTENWTITKKTEETVVEYKKEPGQRGAEVGVETYTTEKKGFDGDAETTTRTTVTTTTSKNKIQDGGRTRTETRTVKRIVTKTSTAQEYEEY